MRNKQIAGLERRIAKAIDRGHSEQRIRCLRDLLESLRAGEVYPVDLGSKPKAAPQHRESEYV